MYINLAAGIYDQHISLPSPKRFNWKKEREREKERDRETPTCTLRNNMEKWRDFLPRHTAST